MNILKKIKYAVKRWRIEIEDWFRYNHAIRFILANVKKNTIRRKPDSPQEIARVINKLCEAARLAVTQKQQLEIESEIAGLIKKLDGRNIDWREFEPSAEKRLLEGATVLKPYISEREKGVVYLSFEYQWTRLLQNCDIKEFARQYILVVAPVWANPYGLVNYLLPAIWNDKIFSHLSDPNDARILPRISQNYIVVPLLCSSWVNPDWFKPVPFSQKDIDLVMLANFGKYKRHFALFKALRDMPRSLQIVLIGQRHQQRTKEVLMDEARAYGVEDRFELWENPTDEQMFNALARAKTSLILSRREGSCIAVVESIFSNTPAALLKNAEVGSRIFINDKTGIFLEPQNIGEQLTRFIQEAHKFSPRQWAMDNKIHCFESSAILNKIIKNHCLSLGLDWTQDIATLHWRPTPQPVYESDKAKLQEARRQIKDKFGIILGKDHL